MANTDNTASFPPFPLSSLLLFLLLPLPLTLPPSLPLSFPLPPFNMVGVVCRHLLKPRPPDMAGFLSEAARLARGRSLLLQATPLTEPIRAGKSLAYFRSDHQYIVLCIVYCVLCVLYMYIVYCVLCIVYCVLCIVYVYCVLCIVLYIVYCVLCIVYCILCIVYCAS